MDDNGETGVKITFDLLDNISLPFWKQAEEVNAKQDIIANPTGTCFGTPNCT